MSLLRSVFVVLALLSVVGAAFGASSFGNNSFTIRVYSDGSAIMTQNLTVVPGAASVDVPLLTPILSNLVATDQNGSPLSFRISGSNITIYTLGATGVTLRYDSLALTNKTGTVWSLVFETRYNATVVLPRLSSLSYVSGTTYTLSVQNGSPVVEVPPGLWQMTYGVSIGSDGSGATTTTPQNGGGPFGLIPYFGGSEFGLVALGAVVMGGGFLLFRWWRGRLDLGPQGEDLRPDDVQVLNFIQEKGGKVLEPEIRMRFALPKTSAWRQIKRLERLGYLKVTKIGSQNQIEFLKNREPGA